MLDADCVDEACDGLQGVLIILAEAAHERAVPSVPPERFGELMADLNALGRAIAGLTEAAAFLLARPQR